MMKSRRQTKTFHFKKFSVNHDRCTMKVGTDAVLLGAWVSTTSTRRILDIGTGSAVIALMVAQRTTENAFVDAVEVEKVDAEQAIENVALSPWPSRIRVHQKAIQDYETPHRYDLIVSNPPYFINSLLPPSPQRSTARHAHDLPFGDLLTHALRLLKSDGRIAVILPYAEGNIFKTIAGEKHLHLIRETVFYSRKEKPPERLLMEFSRIKATLTIDELILYDNQEKMTEDYMNLTKDFYL